MYPFRKTIPSRSILVLIISWGAFAGLLLGTPPQDGLSDYNREAGLIMLQQVRRDIERYHFDPHFKGVNLDTVFGQARQQIQQAKNNSEVFRALAAATRAFQDSHTRFLAPRRGYAFDYGWEMMPVGQACLIKHVRAGSDGELKGLKRGDRLLAIDDTPISRATMSAWRYLLWSIEPRNRLTLTVAAPDGSPRKIEIATKITPREHNIDLARDFNLLARKHADLELKRRSKFKEYGDVFVWKLQTFAGDKDDLREGIRRTHGYTKLILDLRGNSGGYEEAFLELLSVLMGKDTKAGILRAREGSKPVVAELRGHKPWKGQLFVLVDGLSASASEILATVVQQQARGYVLGDRTAGAVQRSIVRTERVGAGPTVYYGMQVAVSEWEFENGRKLEGVGMVPDFLLIPTQEDIASLRDPVMAMALKQAGQVVDPATLGRDFPDEPEALDEE